MSDPIPVAFVRDPSIEPSRVSDATGSLTYRSAGTCLVVGELEAGLDALTRLPSLSCSVFVPDAGQAQPEKRLLETGVAVISGGSLVVSGHLGDFTAHAGDGDAVLDLAVATWRENGRFDLLLDLCREPLFGQSLPPFGYAHLPPGTDSARVLEALQALDGLVGEFDKPRYFRYRADICAHSRSSLTGCSNCLDICATGAISASGDGVSVDPWLCQGCGSCATVCPSGAMSYAYPTVPEAVERTRQLATGAAVDTLLLHVEADRARIDALALPGHVLDLLVEEVSAFGLDYWLTFLAGGIGRILVLNEAPPEDANRRALLGQIDVLNHLLAGLGDLPADGPPGRPAGSSRVRLIDGQALAAAIAEPACAGAASATGLRAFAVQDDKRATIRMALDLLAESCPPREPVVALPPGSPFGRIEVNASACTLCMACVSTCPAGALLDGQDVPALRLIESSCVQCGLCEQACPEQAITLQARYLWDSVEARRTRTLHEEPPFHCVRCHTPFATQRLIETMSAKLADHWMFAKPAAMRRLKMCEDCRVKDLFENEPDGPDVHSGAVVRPGEQR